MLQVYTMSLHLKEDGFYPGSGECENVGLGNGRCISNLKNDIKIHEDCGNELISHLGFSI